MQEIQGLYVSSSTNVHSVINFDIFYDKYLTHPLSLVKSNTTDCKNCQILCSIKKTTTTTCRVALINPMQYELYLT